jgi:segregation and condensation protein B
MRQRSSLAKLWAGPRARGTLSPCAHRQPIAPPRVQQNLTRRPSRRREEKPAPPPVAQVEQPGMRGEKMQALEAVLLLAHEPLPSRKLSQYANLADGTEALTLIRQLNRLYDAEGRAFRVEQLAGGFQLLTRPALADWVRRLAGTPPEVRLSSPALETLAVVAYRQPVLRAEVEAIRGVACGEMIRQLMERDLVRIAGRSEELGRPFLYGTTNRFLQVFGLAHLDDLPRSEALRRALLDNRTADTLSADISGTKEGSTVTMTQSGSLLEEKVRRSRAEEDELRTGTGVVVAADDDEDEDFGDDDDADDDDDDEDEDDDAEDGDEDFDEDYDEDFDDEDDDDEEWEDDEEEEAVDEEADGEWEEVEDDEESDEEEEDDEDDEDEDEDDDWGDDDEEEEEDDD